MRKWRTLFVACVTLLELELGSSSSGLLKELDARALKWLRESVMPLWTRAGFDQAAGVFEESLTASGEPAGEPRRSMVQVRQIYSLKTAGELGVLSDDAVRSLTLSASRSLISRYQMSSGAYMHSLRVDGSVASERPDLYTQAFSIFGMACAFSLHRDDAFKTSALRVVEYLRRERAVEGGGFTEVSADGSLFYASNPHMHLFEAALEWMEFDRDPVWISFASEIAELAMSRFVDPYGSGFLAEHFASDWSLVRAGDGRFMFEPGHQFEWAWLLQRYERLTGLSFGVVPSALYDGGSEGIIDGFAVDEMWSDGSVRSASARFWPQAERVKAASLRRDTDSAVEAMSALLTYLETPRAGLWFDSRRSDGSFATGNAKGSSLYHIIGAISEFHKLAEASR